MRPGARSLRGAMGAYAAAGALAVLALALVLGLGGPEPARAEVRLLPRPGLSGAVLEAGGERHALQPGQSLQLPPGRWRVTLLEESGGRVLELDLPPGAVTLGG